MSDRKLKEFMKAHPVSWIYHFTQLIVVLIALGITFGINSSQIGENEQDIENIRVWQSKHEDFAFNEGRRIEDRFDELERLLTQVLTRLDYLVPESAR
jgi:hypothetical protein